MKREKKAVGGGGPWETPRSRSRTTTDSRSRPMPAPAPDFAIIGAMKSATSTLHVQLSAVSGVAMSSPKEPCFFSDDEIFARGEAWYDACFAHAGPGDLRGESSTHYTKLPTLPHACERLHRRRPDAKLLYVIRHPIDRLISHYVHGWTEGWHRGDLERAIDDAGFGRMHRSAAQSFVGHFFIGHGFDDVRTGHIHVRRVLHHEDEIRQRRRVNIPPRTRAHNHRDLRNDAG